VRARLSVQLPPQDEAALSWFYGPGQSLLERSTMGGMLERAELFSVSFLPDPEQDRARREWEREAPWTEPPGALSARPRSGGHTSSGYTPEEGLVSRYAQVSRLVRAVSERDAGAAGALSLYYGDEGSRWGETTRGRMFSLYAYTAAGRELLHRHRTRKKGADLGLSHAEELSVVAEVNRVQPVTARRVLLERAHRQAQVVYEHAVGVFLQVKEERRHAS